MAAELKTLFWLQWRLTMAMFRRKDAQGIARLLQQALLVLQLVFTFPTFILMGIGLAVGLALITPRAAFEVVVILNTFLMFVWLLLPASYSGQLIARFEMTQLFPHPISFRSLVVGSTLMSLVSVTGLWTLPLLLGEIIGLTIHAPLAFPLIALGALPVFALLVLTGRVMDDLFDLVAGDRRLRAAVIFVLTLPFMILGFGQYILQYLTKNYESMDQLEVLLGAGAIQRLEQARSFSQWMEALNLSRLLLWLPPGWASAGMALPGSGEWGRGLLYLSVALVFVAAMLLLHAGITKQLMQGAALSLGAERVRSRSWRMSLPGSEIFWALLRKDWLHLFRNPMPKRMLLNAPFMVLPILVMFGSDADSQIPFVRDKMPFLIICFFMALLFFVMNVSISGNYFGTIDREGFAILALTPLDRRWVLLSANLAMLALAGATYLLLALAVGIVTGRWASALLALLMAFCLQVSCAPALNLAAILGPYRTQLKMQGRQRGNLWGFLGALAAPPVLLLFLIPYIFWTPGLWLTVPLAIVYSVGAYWFTLGPLSRMLQQREHEILMAVTTGD